jgi:hypothetical protein
MKYGDNLYITCMFKDQETFDRFKEEAAQDQKPTVAVFEVKELVIFTGNACIRPKDPIAMD